MKRKVTIADIAAEAGVSVATVSRFITGKGTVSPATGARLDSLIHQYSYDTRLLSRGLRKEPIRTIGCIVQELAHPYFVKACSALETCTRELGVAMLLGVGTDRPEIEERAIHLFLEKGIDGLILMGGSANFVQPTDRFRAVIASAVERCPVAFINGYYEMPGILQVRSDDIAGLRELMERAYALGHRRFAYIGGDPASGAAQARQRVFVDWLAEKGLPRNPEWVMLAGFGIQHGAQAINHLLGWKEAPTAVICCNDVVATGAIETLRERGYRVPADISVLGFDGTNLLDYPEPPISSVAQDFIRLGALAIDGLLENAALAARGTVLTVPTHPVAGITLGPPA